MEGYYAGLKQLFSEKYRNVNSPLMVLIGEERFAQGVDSLKGIDVLIIARQTSDELPVGEDFKNCIFQHGRLEGISRDGTVDFYNSRGLLSKNVLDIIPVHTLRLPENYQPEASLLKRFTFSTRTDTLTNIDIDSARAYLAVSESGMSLKLDYIEKIRRGMD